MAIYENENSDKAALAPLMFNGLIASFGGTFSDYSIAYGGVNPNYLRIETQLASLEELTDFVDNFQAYDPELTQKQLDNAKRGLFIKRKFSSLLDKREIKLWL